MVYLTGDTHGDFNRIKAFCDRMNTTSSDILIILGDAGINYYGPVRDRLRKEKISTLPITLFCVHGNHEQRPYTLPDYHEILWQGGQVYAEDAFPNLLFAKDGEIYDIAGKRALVIGGAFSVDRMYRVARGLPWWPDEQPSGEIRARVEKKLDLCSRKVDLVLSHTVPMKYVPRENFIDGIAPTGVDFSTEKWLDKIEERLDYEKWYAGHLHMEKEIDKLEILFENYAVIG